MHFVFTRAQLPGKMKITAVFLTRLEANSNEKIILKIRENVPTESIEVSIGSTGKAQEDQVLI